jgi:hypothetical protein
MGSLMMATRDFPESPARGDARDETDAFKIKKWMLYRKSPTYD